MTEQRLTGQHTVRVEHRGRLVATGISRVDFFSEELITAQTELGQLNIKGEGLHIEVLSAESGDMTVLGKVSALSYTESAETVSFLRRLFK